MKSLALSSRLGWLARSFAAPPTTSRPTPPPAAHPALVELKLRVQNLTDADIGKVAAFLRIGRDRLRCEWRIVFAGERDVLMLGPGEAHIRMLGVATAVAYTIPADFGVTIWDMQKSDAGRQSFALTDGSRPPRLAFSSDGQHLAITARNGVLMVDFTRGTMNLWNLARAITLRVIFSPDGQWLAATFQDPSLESGSVKRTYGGVWSVRDQRRIAALENRANDIRFTSDSRYLLVTNDDKSVALWDFENNQVVSRLNLGG